jgi:hypothetical protein
MPDAPTLAFLDTVEGWVTGEELELLRIRALENALGARSSGIRNVA